MLVHAGSIVVDDAGAMLRLPGDHDVPGTRVFLGAEGAAQVWAAVLDADALAQLPPGARLEGLRDAIGRLADADGREAEHELALAAVALANWHDSHAHCPQCGAPTELRSAGWVVWCPVDEREWYPRTDPAVIVAMTDPDDRLLIAHAAYWSAKRYSLLAGYVEPGESLEQAVHREVAEEASLRLRDLVYIGSQPWPFPASLMAGFTAKVDDPAFTLDTTEISDAKWVTRPELVELVRAGEIILAPRGSIARQMVEDWYGGPIPSADS